MVQSQLLILASAAASAAAAAADVSSLIQKDVQSHAVPEPLSSSCECIGWQDAYNKHGMKCGGGKELEVATWKHGIPGPIAAQYLPELAQGFCKGYFEKLPNDGYCVNDYFRANPTEWCYVSPGCSQGYKAQEGDLFVKNCSREQDATLGEMKFEELANYSSKHGLDVSTAAQFAYPQWSNESLYSVGSFWGVTGLGTLFLGEVSPDLGEGLRERLKAHVKSGRTVFIRSANITPPWGVSEGGKLYVIGPNLLDQSPGAEPSLWSCVAGCEPASEALG